MQCVHELTREWCAICTPITNTGMGYVVATPRRVDVEDDRVTLQRETSRAMPELFVARYAELVEMAVGTVMGGVVGDPNMPKGPPDRPTNAYGGVIRDAVAHRYRQAVDGRLRALSRDIRAFIVTSSAERTVMMKQSALKCASCAKFVDHEWRHCAWCGKAQGMTIVAKDKITGEEVDRVTTINADAWRKRTIKQYAGRQLVFEEDK